MPLVCIHLPQGKSAEYRSAISDVVYDVTITTLNVPENNRFHVITEHASADLIIDPTYHGIHRSQDALIIQITLNKGRATLELKKAYYKALADGLHARLGLRREDVFISLVEVKKENWSLGNGEAQYA
ncbi:tautomerase family protein [Noviherbaspirillum suwonense]|jgi:phenylpyruvate tautomerase PptA (4-oxalocrotonate tautomerase family)|uniref:Phenylpyruvate tautomerase PptA, 4-oxalocrotonate tautomerase family n=1 Tax=Noviherbaspirillum suwonense TaxID=1224511 RepID=A0ABY1QP45_9BURK|nr:tautomerase family protein [Noviherbaspirillum suwonense]SMP75202.1 Phenylpyruvate tautomerase PptA, 4-oxalocrotonate tautomerase family [Noviherbaspirillum suwonense]